MVVRMRTFRCSKEGLILNALLVLVDEDLGLPAERLKSIAFRIGESAEGKLERKSPKHVQRAPGVLALVHASGGIARKQKQTPLRDFILKAPSHLTTSQVVDLAKEQGVSVSMKYVQQTRRTSHDSASPPVGKTVKCRGRGRTGQVHVFHVTGDQSAAVCNPNVRMIGPPLRGTHFKDAEQHLCEKCRAIDTGTYRAGWSAKANKKKKQIVVSLVAPPPAPVPSMLGAVVEPLVERREPSGKIAKVRVPKASKAPKTSPATKEAVDAMVRAIVTHLAVQKEPLDTTAMNALPAAKKWPEGTFNTARIRARERGFIKRQGPSGRYAKFIATKKGLEYAKAK